MMANNEHTAVPLFQFILCFRHYFCILLLQCIRNTCNIHKTRFYLTAGFTAPLHFVRSKLKSSNDKKTEVKAKNLKKKYAFNSTNYILSCE